MKTSVTAFRFVAAFVASLLFALEVRPAGADEAAGTGSKPAIARGMSAETVRSLIGEPVEIRSITNEGLKAESWIYRRKMGSDVTQEAVLVEQVPAFAGLGYGNSDNIDMINVPAYRLKRTTRTQVTALLMVEGTLVLARQWVEREADYEN